MPIAVGGVILAFIFEFSRKPQFRCQQCGTAFYSHTLLSRLFLILWIWFLLIFIFILLIIIAEAVGGIFNR